MVSDSHQCLHGSLSLVFNPWSSHFWKETQGQFLNSWWNRDELLRFQKLLISRHETEIAKFQDFNNWRLKAAVLFPCQELYLSADLSVERLRLRRTERSGEVWWELVETLRGNELWRGENDTPCLRISWTALSLRTQRHINKVKIYCLCFLVTTACDKSA